MIVWRFEMTLSPRAVEAAAEAMKQRRRDEIEHGLEYATFDELATLALTAALAVDGLCLVPKEPTRAMLNAAIDVDSFKLGNISPLGFRESPQHLFQRCYAAMLAVANDGEERR